MAEWVPARRQARSTALVCFPHAGGGAAPFFRWQRTVPDFIEVLPVRLPARESRLHEPHFGDLQSAAERVADELADERADDAGPLAFVGHSMGALLAFETAHVLRHRGRPGPRLLAAVACRGPTWPATRPWLHDQDDASFVRSLTERFRSLPPELVAQPEWLAAFLPTLRADLRAVETYVGGGSLECPILAFGGTDDREIGPAALGAWRAATSGEFSLKLVSGNHFFLHEQPQAVLRDVVRRLAAPQHPDA